MSGKRYNAINIFVECMLLQHAVFQTKNVKLLIGLAIRKAIKQGKAKGQGQICYSSRKGHVVGNEKKVPTVGYPVSDYLDFCGSKCRKNRTAPMINILSVKCIGNDQNLC